MSPFLRTFLVTALFMLGSIAALNVVIDPLQQYHLAESYPVRYYPAEQRLLNPGLARHASYTRLVTGSSLMENVDTRDVDRAYGHGRSINLSISAMTAFDAAQLLRVALDTGKPQHIIIHLDYNAFSGASDRSGFADAFPGHLYNRWWLDDAPYWLSLATTRKSIDILRGTSRNTSNARFSTNPYRPWYWADGVEFSAAKATRGIDPQHINRQFKQPDRTLDGMLASFDTNLLPLMRAHPEVKWSLVYLPYSSLVWADFHQRGQVDITLQFREAALARTTGLTNVTWHDFQADAALVEDLSHYTDIYHFSPTVSRTLIARIARGEGKLTRETIVQNNAWLNALSTRVDPVRVVREAQRAAVH